MAAAELPPDAKAAVNELKKKYAEGYMIDDGMTSEIIDVNHKNLDKIAADLAIQVQKRKEEDLANADYNDIAKALADGFITGTQGSAELTEEATAALMEGNLNKAKEILGVESPSTEMYEIGTYMADGLIAGFFGDERLIQGSNTTGFISRFSEQMQIVSDTIEQNYVDISRSAVAAISTKLGRVGEILKGDKPITVVVDNKKLAITVNLSVAMDSYDLANAIYNAPGGSYFEVNMNRDYRDDNLRELEIDGLGESAV